MPLATTGAPLPPNPDANPVPNGAPFNDHFTVIPLDEMTFAIAEPYSWARNVNYLIVGEQKALLFDAGVGHYDIRPVVESLTDLPLIFMPSHFHYDHTGQGDWGYVAIVDLPHLRARAVDNRLQPTWGEHLGSAEGIEPPTWLVSEWIAPGSNIDLGDRQLTLVYTPGHTNNSVSLWDKQRALMFTGDFLHDSGSLGAVYPRASLGDYLQSANKVLNKTQNTEQIMFRGAHAAPDNTVPENRRSDLANLKQHLLLLKQGQLDGQGTYPVTYAIGENQVLSAEPAWLHDWSVTYPDDHPAHQ